MFWSLFNDQRYACADWVAVWCMENAIQSVIAIDLHRLRRRPRRAFRSAVARGVDDMGTLALLESIGKDRNWADQFLASEYDHARRYIMALPGRCEPSAEVFGFHRRRVIDCMHRCDALRDWFRQLGDNASAHLTARTMPRA